MSTAPTRVIFYFSARLFSFDKMVRQLKFHEQKLLKKVDFLQWKTDQTMQEIKVMRRYHLQNRDDYHKYPPRAP
jgi:hypothetical protein